MALRFACGRGAVGKATPLSGFGSQGVAISGARRAEDFLFGGTSALLLLGANLFPGYGIASFAALIPLLYRVTRADPRRAARLGLYFGLSFFGVSLVDLCLVSPVVGLCKIACGTALFASFGWVVAWGRRRWGFNPLIVALLWIGLELAIIKLGFSAGLLAGARAGHPLFHGMAALFGFLSISFLIVLLDSLIISAIDAFSNLAPARGTIVFEGERMCDLLLTPGPAALQLCLVPENRGPPLLRL